MLPLALLLAVSAGRLTIFDELVSLGPGEIKTVNLSLNQRPAVIEAAFKVLGGQVVSVGLRGPAGAGPPGEPRFLRIMREQSSGALRFPARVPGDYQLLLENPRRRGQPVSVAFRVTVAFDEPGTLRPETLSPARRRTVVALSLLFFLFIVWWSGRRLLEAIARRKHDEQFPPF
jgi:hypothetical protein